MKGVSIFRGTAAVLVATVMLISLGTAGVAAKSGSDFTGYFDVDFEIARMIQQARGGGSGSEPQNLDLLGQLGPADDPAFAFPNSDVWAHGDFAYVGTWGFFGFCPATGVKVVDISDPTNPTLVTTIPSHLDTRANDIKVAEIETDFFEGDLLAHSDEECGPEGFSGFHLFDVTDPTDPVHLSRFDTGPVHDLFLFERDDRAFVLLAIPFSEVFGAVFGTAEDTGTDLQIVEVTDPSNPVLVGTWTIGRDTGLAFGSPFFAGIPGLPPGSDCTPPAGTPALCRGDDFPGVFLHDVWTDEDGEVAFLSYWDAGLILLDIEDPTNPTLIGRGTELVTFGSDEGNLHNAVPADDDLVLVLDEDFTPGPWGFLRMFDIDDPENPVQVGAFATDNALTDRDDGFFSAHNAVVEDDLAFLSWYTDGIRVIDISDPSNPQEIASFSVPLEDLFTAFWGVFVLDDFEGDDFDDDLLVLGSDIFTGLYILKLSEEDDD